MPEKILFILHLPPPIHGASMVGGFIQKSDLINKSFECRYINLSTSSSVAEIGKKPFLKTSRYFSILFQVIRQILVFKPSECYLTITAKGVAFYKDAIIAVVIKLFGVKLIYHFHNKGVSSRQDRPFDNFLYDWIFRKSHVILLSEYLYTDIKKYVPENRVHYCPNGIPNSFTQSTADVVQNFSKIKDSEPVKILFLSNLIESKGILVLLDACRILLEKQALFQCIFVGSEGNITGIQFQKIVKESGLSKHVYYLGKKYDKEKEKVFSDADIFAFPTYYDNECFPLVILEAMQFSLPVISTYEGGIPDIVENGKSGFLVPQKDAATLAEKLEILILDAELRKKMGAAGRKKYEEEFTLEKFENRFTEILTNITNRGK